jgi:cytochrome b561
LTSEDCLRMALAIFWALSSGVNSMNKGGKRNSLNNQLYVLHSQLGITPFLWQVPRYTELPWSR